MNEQKEAKSEIGTEIRGEDILRLMEKTLQAHKLGQTVTITFAGLGDEYFAITVHGDLGNEGFEFYRNFTSMNYGRQIKFAECEAWLDSFIKKHAPADGNPTGASKINIPEL